MPGVTDGSPAPRVHDVVAGVLVDAGRVLLCHRHPDRAWFPGVWDLPGGHIEDDERPVGALARELAEELGISLVAPPPEPARVVHPSHDVELQVWVLTRWDGTVTNLAPEEHDALGWFSSAELDDLEVADPGILDLCRQALDRRV